LPNPDRSLVDGQFVSVDLRERKEQPRLVVAPASLQVDQAGYYVLIVNGDGKVEQRRVTVGRARAWTTVIQSGLKLGEQVIVEASRRSGPARRSRPP